MEGGAKSYVLLVVRDRGVELTRPSGRVLHKAVARRRAGGETALGLGALRDVQHGGALESVVLQLAQSAVRVGQREQHGAGSNGDGGSDA